MGLIKAIFLVTPPGQLGDTSMTMLRPLALLGMAPFHPQVFGRLCLRGLDPSETFKQKVSNLSERFEGFTSSFLLPSTPITVRIDSSL